VEGRLCFGDSQMSALVLWKGRELMFGDCYVLALDLKGKVKLWNGELGFGDSHVSALVL
jgi:hypothetical protein